MNKLKEKNSFHLIIILSSIFLVAIATGTFLALHFNMKNSIIFQVIYLSIMSVFLILLLYLLIDFLLKYLNKNGDKKKNITDYKKDKHFRRVINSYIGVTINFGYSIFYFIYGYVMSSQFYLISAIFFFLAYIARTYLLTFIFNNKEDKIIKGYLVASILSFLLSLTMISIVSIVYANNIRTGKNQYIVYAICLYTFIKFISSQVSFFSSRKHQDIMLQAFSIISLALSVYSMFMLTITIPPTFAENYEKSFAFFGFPMAGILVLLTLSSIINAAKLIKKEKKNEQIEN